LKTFSSHVARHLSQPTKISIDTAKEDTVEEQVLDAEKSEE
jgi:hypothetical protein